MLLLKNMTDPKVAVAVFIGGITAQLSPDLDEVEIVVGWQTRRLSVEDARTLADAIIALADSVKR